MNGPEESKTSDASSASSSDDPVEENPFAASNPRHLVWEKATLGAEEEVHRLKSHLSETVATDIVDWDARAGAQTERKFDIWAQRGVLVVWNRSDLKKYDAWLLDYKKAWLESWEPRARDHSSVFLAILERTLTSRVEYWKAEARRRLDEQEKQVGDTPPKNTGPKSSVASNPPTTSRKNSFQGNAKSESARRGQYVEKIIRELTKLKQRMDSTVGSLDVPELLKQNRCSELLAIARNGRVKELVGSLPEQGPLLEIAKQIAMIKFPSVKRATIDSDYSHRNTRR